MTAKANGLYVAFEPREDRVKAGAKIGLCNRCGKLVGHWPRDSFGHEIICLSCANDIPAIRRRLDELTKHAGGGCAYYDGPVGHA